MNATQTAPAPVVTSLTSKQRWAKAIREVRKEGVAIKQNVRDCCRSCIVPNDLFAGIDDLIDPYAYSYGGQGMATKWVNDVMVPAQAGRFASGAPVDKVYFSHENNAAQVLRDVFTANGFDVEWNGSENQCVTVNPNS